MTPEQVKQIWEFMGRIDERTKNLCDKFDALPCSSNRKDIDDLQDYKNQLVGRMSIIAIICGAVGWGITAVISYFLNRG